MSKQKTEPKRRWDQVVLEITNWAFSLGGEHFSGTLKGDINGKLEFVEVTKPLTQKEATYLNKKDNTRFARFKRGQQCGRFETRAAVERAAIAQWRKLFPDADVLVEGRYAVASPQRPLDGDPELVNHILAYYEAMDAERGWTKRAMQISDHYWDWHWSRHEPKDWRLK